MVWRGCGRGLTQPSRNVLVMKQDEYPLEGDGGCSHSPTATASALPLNVSLWKLIILAMTFHGFPRVPPGNYGTIGLTQG
jgi:hypothetical protein